MSKDTCRLSTQDLTDLAVQSFQNNGLAYQDAIDTSTVLVMADLFGISTHGVSRIPSYVDRLKCGGINKEAQIKVESVAPAMIKIDGDNGLGPLIGMRALKLAIETARTTGVAMAWVKGSNHFGPIAPYCAIAAEEGFATIIASNATSTITPWGGKDARVGNNPIGFGVPRPGADPLILDIALSVAARAKIRNAHKNGQSIPQGWATDANGYPTTNPGEALNGFLLPVGGHKGYGLALMVDMLAGLLSGAAFLTQVSSWQDQPDKPQNLGHFFLLMDTKRLGSSDWLSKQMSDFVDTLHETPAAIPESPVLVPGELEFRRMKEQTENGIELPIELVTQIKIIAIKKEIS